MCQSVLIEKKNESGSKEVKLAQCHGNSGSNRIRGQSELSRGNQIFLSVIFNLLISHQYHIVTAFVRSSLFYCEDKTTQGHSE